MDVNWRPTSSVYSDAFELDELLDRVSEQAAAQKQYIIWALEEERDTVRRELEKERNRWASIYELMLEAADAGEKLALLHQDAERRVGREQNVWVSNCTPI
jgi:hypothetical protein